MISFPTWSLDTCLFTNFVLNPAWWKTQINYTHVHLLIQWLQKREKAEYMCLPMVAGTSFILSQTMVITSYISEHNNLFHFFLSPVSCVLNI